MIFHPDESHQQLGVGRTGGFSVLITDDDGSIHSFGTNPRAVLGVKRNPEDDKPLFTIGTTPDTSSGIAEFAFLPEYTVSLMPGTYFYDVALYENDGDYFDVIRGSMLDLIWTASTMADAVNPTYIQTGV